MNYYDCHWDSSVWLRSLGVMGLLAAIYAFLVWSRHGRTDMLAWGAVLLLPLLVALAFAPRGYEVTDRTLTVRMVACLARYNLADLRRAEIATPGEAFGFPTSRMCVWLLRSFQECTARELCRLCHRQAKACGSA